LSVGLSRLVRQYGEQTTGWKAILLSALADSLFILIVAMLALVQTHFSGYRALFVWECFWRDVRLISRRHPVTSLRKIGAMSSLPHMTS
jgi:hypothetical protein